MQNLKTTVINTFGEQGKKWLQELPQTTESLKKLWQLSDLHPMPNMTYHFVAAARNRENQPVVLKVGCDPNLTKKEALTLKELKSPIMTPLLDYAPTYNALLLEQALPGTPLKSFYPKQTDFVIKTFAQTIQKLHQHHSQTEGETIHSWLKALDHCQGIPKPLLEKAMELKENLLATMTDFKLLHGDLHLDNILQHQDSWMCIDPKGVIGELAFEVAAFDLTPDSKACQSTIEKLAKSLELCPKRVKNWFFVRQVLSAAWSIEDCGDPSSALQLAFVLS